MISSAEPWTFPTYSLKLREKEAVKWIQKSRG